LIEVQRHYKRIAHHPTDGTASDKQEMAAIRRNNSDVGRQNRHKWAGRRFSIGMNLAGSAIEATVDYISMKLYFNQPRGIHGRP